MVWLLGSVMLCSIFSKGWKQTPKVKQVSINILLLFIVQIALENGLRVYATEYEESNNISICGYLRNVFLFSLGSYAYIIRCNTEGVSTF